MTENVVLVTGANGEIGHGLLKELAEHGSAEVVTADLQPIGSEIRPYCAAAYQADITDRSALERIFDKHPFTTVFHLAAILSTEGERNPIRTHRVNVDGTLNLLELSRLHGAARSCPIRFVFPSTIAVYGIKAAEKGSGQLVTEEQFLEPATMYGINKLYAEHLGRYYSGTLGGEQSYVDFRGVRLPGVVSGVTVPTGGTSDYFPEMLHAAARGASYDCFVSPESRLPFMVMPDAVKALIDISRASSPLGRRVYNVSSFSLSAAEIRDRIMARFPQARIGFKIDSKRQKIVDSWPGNVDDGAARRDWAWRADYPVAEAFESYLVPQIAARYRSKPEVSELRTLEA